MTSFCGFPGPQRCGKRAPERVQSGVRHLEHPAHIGGLAPVEEMRGFRSVGVAPLLPLQHPQSNEGVEEIARWSAGNERRDSAPRCSIRAGARGKLREEAEFDRAEQRLRPPEREPELHDASEFQLRSSIPPLGLCAVASSRRRVQSAAASSPREHPDEAARCHVERRRPFGGFRHALLHARCRACSRSLSAALPARPRAAGHGGRAAAELRQPAGFRRQPACPGSRRKRCPAAHPQISPTCRPRDRATAQWAAARGRGAGEPGRPERARPPSWPLPGGRLALRQVPGASASAMRMITRPIAAPMARRPGAGPHRPEAGPPICSKLFISMSFHLGRVPADHVKDVLPHELTTHAALQHEPHPPGLQPVKPALAGTTLVTPARSAEDGRVPHNERASLCACD